MRDLNTLCAQVDTLLEIVARQAEQIEALTQTDSNLLAARAIIQDAQYLCQLRGFVSAERAAYAAHQAPVACIHCAADGMPFMDENGLVAPLAVGFAIETGGAEYMFPRALK